MLASDLGMFPSQSSGGKLGLFQISHFIDIFLLAFLPGSEIWL